MIVRRSNRGCGSKPHASYDRAAIHIYSHFLGAIPHTVAGIKSYPKQYEDWSCHGCNTCTASLMGASMCKVQALTSRCYGTSFSAQHLLQHSCRGTNQSEATCASRGDTLMTHSCVPGHCHKGQLPAFCRLQHQSGLSNLKMTFNFKSRKFLFITSSVLTATGYNEDNLFKKPLNNVVYKRIRFSLGWTLPQTVQNDWMWSFFPGKICTAIFSVRLFFSLC